MPAAEPAAVEDKGRLVERYEELRRRVLGGEPDGFRLGLAVLQRQGLAGWLRAWGDLATPAGRPTPTPPVAAGTSVASDLVVAVLASMTLACADRSAAMSLEAATKVTAGHLARTAYLYVRQSTLRQVMTNTESATRQYGLRQRAVAMGWAAEQIVVIDCDQGQSGSSAVDREGFQRLAAEVGMGRAGIVLGLEVSRLARNNADWHRLLELCALGATLICDEDGLYDPCDFNDRLLLGLKGTMSEAELHFIRARLRGGILSKAKRGELIVALPVGFIYDPADHVVLDPDAGVQHAIRHLFATFARTGSARAVVQTFAAEGLQFPLRVRSGPAKGELAWESLAHWRVLRTLHNPRYAGAFFFGRHRWRPAPGGKTTMELLPRDKWIALIPDAHPGYIAWDVFEANQTQLLSNAQAEGSDRAGGPAREGTALLQGLAICGRCGRRMTVRYHHRQGVEVPDYQCMATCISAGVSPCLRVPGAGIDDVIATLVLDTLTPVALEVALSRPGRDRQPSR